MAGSHEIPPPIPPPVIASVRKQRAPTLYAIIGFKLLKSALLLVAAAAIFSLAGQDLQREFNRVLAGAEIDPTGRLFEDFGRWLQTVTPDNVRIFATGTLLYSAFSLIEGAGLWLRAGWAGWMAIAESACFVPVELYQMSTKYSAMLLAILVLNVVTVWYLYVNRERLFRH